MRTSSAILPALFAAGMAAPATSESQLSARQVQQVQSGWPYPWQPQPQPGQPGAAGTTTCGEVWDRRSYSQAQIDQYAKMMCEIIANPRPGIPESLAWFPNIEKIDFGVPPETMFFAFDMPQNMPWGFPSQQPYYWPGQQQQQWPGQQQQQNQQQQQQQPQQQQQQQPWQATTMPDRPQVADKVVIDISDLTVCNVVGMVQDQTSRFGSWAPPSWAPSRWAKCEAAQPAAPADD